MIEFQNRLLKLTDSSLVMVCRIVGSIDGGAIPQFEEKLLSFLEEGVKYLILVFSQVKYINSSGMGILVKVIDRFHEARGEVTLIDVPEKLIALFNMLGLLAIIKVSKSEEEALRSFQGCKMPASSTAGNSAPTKGSAGTAPVGTGTAPVGKITATAASPKIKPQDKQAGQADISNKATIRTPAPEESPSLQKTVKTPAISLAAKQEKKNNPTASTPKTSVPPISPTTKAKVFILQCQQCGAKVSLGNVLRSGTYRCPKCMAVFKILETGQVKFFPV